VVRAPTRDNLHSRVVVILKVTLPLLALMILSSLFLFSRPIDPEDAIPYADVEIADRLAQPRMTGAGFSTVTSDGATISLSADQAAPRPGGATIEGLSGQWSAPGGGTTDFSAGTGVLDRLAGQLVLEAGVRLATSTGYVVATDRLTLGTDRSFMESGGEVRATAPMGDLTAGGLRMDRSEDGAAHLLVFNKGVRLIYLPNH
jgi:lipopolysaccharide export system protein LptC